MNKQTKDVLGGLVVVGVLGVAFLFAAHMIDEGNRPEIDARNAKQRGYEVQCEAERKEDGVYAESCAKWSYRMASPEMVELRQSKGIPEIH